MQLLSFGVLSRHFAVLAGLLPNSARGGFGPHADDGPARRPDPIGAALPSWARVGFGDLADPGIPRRGVVGLTSVVVGLQMLFIAFLVGIPSIPTASVP